MKHYLKFTPSGSHLLGAKRCDVLPVENGRIHMTHGFSFAEHVKEAATVAEAIVAFGLTLYSESPEVIVARRAKMSLPMGEFRKRLILRGILPTQVDAMIAQIIDPVERALAQNEWEFQTSVLRTHTLLLSLAPVFQLSPEQVDGIFTNPEPIEPQPE